ncbi:MAG: class I SAM-dependent methyltransferase, partial [Thermoanaerobaculia bacterium]
MTIASRVRRIYERRPYPPLSRRQGGSWTLPSLEWIDALRESPKPFAPTRIFVAGCGVGTEAIAFAQRFPDAEIVGVDFSARSIATARRTQRK